MKSIFLLSILIGEFALAQGSMPKPTPTLSKENCSTVDFTEKFGPVRNQSSSSWCWAFTAADLIGFAQGYGPDKQVSAMDVALSALSAKKVEVYQSAKRLTPKANEALVTYLVDHDFSALESDKLQSTQDRRGSTEYSQHSYQSKGGACLESALPSEFKAAPNEENQFLKSYITSRLEELGDNSVSVSSSDNFQYLANCKTEKLLSADPLVGANGVRTTVRLAEEINREAIRQVIKKVDRSACANRLPLKPMYTAYLVPKEGKTTFELEAAVALKSGHPIAVSYLSNFLVAGRRSQPGGAHASSIVAMKWNANENSCEFKIRNSSGVDCDVYAREFQSKCERGHVWVRGSDLNNFAFLMSVLKPAK